MNVEEQIEKAVEAEQVRWQERFDWIASKYGVDGAGTETSDPLDFTHAEVGMALSQLEYQVADWKAKYEAAEAREIGACHDAAIMTNLYRYWLQMYEDQVMWRREEESKLSAAEARVKEYETMVIPERIKELEAALADAKKFADKAFCVYCKYVGPKDGPTMIDHVRKCAENPWNKLCASLDVEKMLADVKEYERRAEAAEAALADERDKTAVYRHAPDAQMGECDCYHCTLKRLEAAERANAALEAREVEYLDKTHKLEQANAGLREALEFYANRDEHHAYLGFDTASGSRYLKDKYHDAARVALNQNPPAPQKPGCDACDGVGIVRWEAGKDCDSCPSVELPCPEHGPYPPQKPEGER